MIAQLVRWLFEYSVVDYFLFLFHGRLRNLHSIYWRQYCRPGNWARIQLLPLVNFQWVIAKNRRTKRCRSQLPRFWFFFHERFEEIAMENMPLIMPLVFTNFVIQFRSSLKDNVRIFPRKKDFFLALSFEKILLRKTLSSTSYDFPKNFLVKLIFLSVLIDSQKFPSMRICLPKLPIDPVDKLVLGPFLIMGLRAEEINRILTLLSTDETKRSG